MRKALVTLAIGEEHQRIHELTAPRMREYAALIEADYVVVRETHRKPAHFAKFDLLVDMVDQGFEQILYVDADVYIRKHAPNIFDQYAAAAFSEIPHPKPNWVGKATRWIRKHLAADWPLDRYFNTGVLVLSGETLRTLAASIRNVVPKTGVYYEQDQLNVLMRTAGYPVERLDPCWNQFCSEPWITEAKARDAYFLHVTGATGQARLSLIHKFITAYP